jgi:hypothetical protein
MTADEEIDVLLVDLVPVADLAGERLDDVREVDLCEEQAASLGQALQACEEVLLGRGEQRPGGIDIL